MKKLLISAIAAGLMLSACANDKTAPAPRPQLTVEDAMKQCQQSSGIQDRAVFDACMKDKGFLRKDAVAASKAAPANAQ